MEDSKCSVGQLPSSECHKLTYNRKKGFEDVDNLSEVNRELLILRTEAKDEELQTICLHHKNLFLMKYDFLQKFCSDPLKRHKGSVNKNLRPVTRILNEVHHNPDIY